MCGVRSTSSMIRMMSLTFRRALALLVCLMVLILPLQKARAAGFAALAGVAGITVLSAYLMASGVYPYITEAGQTVSEWTEDNIQPLLDKYNAYLASVGKSYQITLQGGAPTIKGYLTQGAIVVANDVWGKLREFAQWVQSEYALTDNQTDVAIGEYPAHAAELPVLSATDKATLRNSGKLILKTGTLGYGQLWYGALTAGCYVIARPIGGGTYEITALSSSRDNFAQIYSYDSGRDVVNRPATNSSQIISYNGVYYYNIFGILLSYIADDVSVYASISDAVSDIFGTPTDFEGIHVDTADISVPDALPDDTPWGGLVVEGAGDVASPSVVEGVIAEAIEQREKPAVQPVTITIPPNTEIDPETGQTDPPIVITPFPVPAPTGLELGEELLDALETHFPFSIPWDLYNIFVHLDAQPVAPRFTLTTPALSSGLAPLTLTIDVATTPFDSFAPVFRIFTGILLAIGMLIGASRWIKR